MKKLLAAVFLFVQPALAQDVPNCKCVYVATPTPTKTRTPTRTATPTRTTVPTATLTPAPTLTPTPAPSLTPTPAPTATPASVPIAKWESQMLQYGAQHCNFLKAGGSQLDPLLSATYYDAARVFWNIRDYTGDPTWSECAQAAEAVYRDRYVIPNNGGVPGYWNFGHGLYEDFLRTGDQASKGALNLLATNCAFCVSNSYNDSPSTGLPGALQSRENAYVLMAYLNQERAGQPLNPRAATLVNNALSHIDQWFVSQSADYVRPFMVALTAEALIQYDRVHPDARVLPALVTAGDAIWSSCWRFPSMAFSYTDRVAADGSGGTEPAPDLNLLIVPFYGWLYQKTGDLKWRDRGDLVFAGGVEQAYLVNPKQFNQNYRWSFDYVRWR